MKRKRIPLSVIRALKNITTTTDASTYKLDPALGSETTATAIRKWVKGKHTNEDLINGILWDAFSGPVWDLKGALYRNNKALMEALNELDKQKREAKEQS